MRKKAFLLGTKTVSMLIGVLCLIVLVYFGFKFLGLTSKQEGKQAEVSLNRIKENIEIVEKEKVSKEFFIESPNGWGIAAWPYEDREEYPKKCYEYGYEGYCLCICEIPATAGISNWLSSCNKNSVCANINEEAYTIEAEWGRKAPILIEGITVLSVSMDNKKIKIEQIKI